MAKRTRSTRPTKPLAAHLTHAYTVRLSEEQAELVQGAAALASLDVSAWMRMISVKNARRIWERNQRPAGTRKS